jgi:hypothetical protein
MGKAQQRLEDLLKSGKVDSLLEQATKEMEEMMLGDDGNGSPS